MKFIILLVSLLLQSFLSLNINKHKSHLLSRYAATMRPLLTKLNADRGWGAFVGLLVPVLIVILILNLLFSHLGILYFLYGVFILLLCLDIQDMKKELADYFSAMSNEDLVSAQVEAEKFLGHSVHQAKSEMSRTVTEAIFTKSLANIFAVIFWFILLGPFGAVLYYATVAIANHACRPEFGYPETYFAADYFKEILDWLPVRFVTLTYALIGHFGPVFNLWIDRLGGGLSENRQFIIDAGLTALHVDLEPSPATVVENQQALNLTTRTLWTWIIIIGVLTLTSML